MNIITKFNKSKLSTFKIDNFNKNSEKSKKALAKKSLEYQSAKTLVFIDSTIEDYQFLLNGVLPGTKTFLLNSEHEGLLQISQILNLYRNVDGVHIISHGSPGILHLGSKKIDLQGLYRYQAQFKSWANALAANAQILLYGCRVAEGNLGHAFIRGIHQFTGANIAASSTPVGSLDRGGSWNFDFKLGHFIPTLAFNSATIDNYPYIFMNSGDVTHHTESGEMNHHTESGNMAHPDDPSKASEHQALLDLIPIETVTHTAIVSGDWFDPNTWEGGAIPTAGAIVRIPENINVTYDGFSETPLFAVRVDGNLTFKAANGMDTKIVVDTLLTTSNSHFEIDADSTTDGTVDIEIRPFDIEEHKATGALGWNTSAINYFSDGATVTDTGARTRLSHKHEIVEDGVGVLGRYHWDPKQLSLGVISHGAVRINGREKLSKTTVSEVAMAGDTSIQLEEVSHGWQIGDQIVIVGTHYVGREADTGESLGSQDEIRTITQINGNTVTFDRALDYNHDTPRDELDAYVANLTRNIKFHSSTDIAIEGVLEADDVGDIATTLGHVMFMHNEDVRVRYASFDDLGRTNKNDVLDDFQRNVFDGLDANRRLKNGEWLETPVDEITNIRGRYAVHLHRAGATATDSNALIEGSVVTGGPGWGFVSHDSRADFHDNVTYGVLGAGFMAETGNETGTWTRNIAINTYGADYNDPIFSPTNSLYSFKDNSTDLTMILEKRGAWKNHDMAHFGNGFWFNGKLIDTVDNVSANSGLDGYFYMFRAPDQINVDPEVLAEPLSVHSPEGIHPFAPGLNVFVGNESIADTRGLEMIGIGGGRTNDERSVIDDFTAWEVGDVGTSAQYYPGYTIKNSTFIASTNPEANAADGVLLRQVQVDTVLANIEIEGFKQQYDLRKKWSVGTINQQGFVSPYTVINEAIANGEPNPLPNGFAHVLIDPGFTAAEASRSQFMGQNFHAKYDLILTTADLHLGRFDIELDDSSLKIDLDNKSIPYGTDPEDPIRPTLQEGHVLLLEGIKTDSIGPIPINYHNNTLVWHEDAVQHRLKTFGYHQMPNNSIGVILSEMFSDRYTAEKQIVYFVAELDPRWEIADSINLGVFDPADHPDVYVPEFLLDPNGISLFNIEPVAIDDSISINENSIANIIGVLENDTNFGNGLASLNVDSISAHGGQIAVDNRGTDDPTDDLILYTPPIDFTGIDTFSYMIADLDGDTDTATVSVTVNPALPSIPVNLVPTAIGDTIIVNGNSTDNAIDVLANDTSFGDGLASLTADSISVNGGAIAVNDLGTTDPNDDFLQYSPADNFDGIDTFSYTITDLDGDTDTATVSVTVNPALPSIPVNLVPTAIGDTIIVNANSTNNEINVLANDTSFGDGLASLTADSISVNGGAIAVNDLGTADPNDDLLQYTPADNFEGTDTFSYTITDLDGDTDTATVSVTVKGETLALPIIGEQIAKLTASDEATNDQFGMAVAVDGDILVVGSRLDDDNGGNSGSAYIFTKQTDGSWIQTAKLTADDAAAGDEFGRSISLDDNTIVIGARNNDDNGSNSGSAYIFTKQTDGSWTQTAKLKADDAASGDEFGSVSISGNNVVIGAFGDDDNGSNSGSAYIFTKQADGSWIQTAKLKADDAASDDEMGRRSIAIHGNNVIVGARGDDNNAVNSGAAYIFTKQADGNWIQTAKLKADDAGYNDLFGMSVSIHGDIAVVGSKYDDDNAANSGAAYIFTKQADGNWIQTAKLKADDAASGDEFGYAVSIKDDILTIGAWRDDHQSQNSGAAYIFTKQADDNWIQTAKLTADDAGYNDLFGYSANTDGKTVVVGAFEDDGIGNNSGSAYIFSLGETVPGNATPTVVEDSIIVDENSVNNAIDVLANDTSFGDGLALLSSDAISTNGGIISLDDRGTSSVTDDLLLYTPPTDFNGIDTFSYTITDSSGDVATTDVTITVNSDEPEDVLIRIDVGGHGFTDIYGNVWKADYGFQGGSISYKDQEIANTDNDEIFDAKRYGENISYDIELANGNYDIVLHMMEPKEDATVGSRVFDVSAEGNLQLNNFDMFVALDADAKPKTAVTATINNVAVTDGQLDLDLSTVAGSIYPVNFAGIEIFSAN